MNNGQELKFVLHYTEPLFQSLPSINLKTTFYKYLASLLAVTMAASPTASSASSFQDVKRSTKLALCIIW